MNAQFLAVRKLWPMFKIRSKVTISTFIVLSERPCHKEHVPNMKALPLSINELWPMLKFFKSRSKATVKVTCSKFMVLLERPCH